MTHSVGLRNSLLAILLVACVTLYRRSSAGRLLQAPLGTSAKLYLLLSAWLLATVLFADDPLDSLSEYRRDWVMGFIALIIGVLMARLAGTKLYPGLNRTTLLASVGLGLALPALIQAGQGMLFFVQHHAQVPWEASLFGRTSLSFAHNIFYGLILADALGRASGAQRLLPLPTWALQATFALSFLCTYLLNTRNGTLGVLAITLFAAIIYWRQHRHQIHKGRLAAFACAMLLAMGVYAKFSYDAEPRWPAFGESTHLALDTEHQRAWLNDSIPLPLMSNGQTVDHSAYMRLAWFKEGVLAIVDYPLGVGFGRNAYGHALQRKYGDGRGRSHSHSGLVDFSLSAGIPGLILWFVLFASLLRLGWRAYFEERDAVGLALIMLIAGTLLRMVVDSNMRDHGLEQYLFLLGVFASLAAASIDTSSGASERTPDRHAAQSPQSNLG
ncbi:MAG: O-antigen ligase family protein [Betaproteobacteria bacterium]